MKIALVGYGKMGHMLEKTVIDLGHEVCTTVDVFAEDAKVKVENGDTESIVNAVVESGAEGIIEFTHPASVMANIKSLLPTKIPLVVGTTGWNDKKEEVAAFAKECGGTIMTSANFSIGVNLFYKICENAAKLINVFDEYDAALWEMHHNQKADSPSGTALDLAKHIIQFLDKKDTVVTNEFKEKPKPHELHVSSTRCGAVPGTHKVFFDSAADTIELSHTARSRQGFASGAVHSIINLKELLDSKKLKPGALYGMHDVFPDLF